jgi:4-amino-4-deoxy-L-arabinose transferase-like glycosyltransferase
MRRINFPSIFLLLIVVLACVLRTYHIAANPPSLSWDEVSIGYNAYSILKTGKDEHERFLPIDTFIGYGDYKPPLAIYATVPFVAIFGLNELAVRLPSALFGTLTVLLTYFLVKEFFRKSLITCHLSLISAFLLAVSPWHVNLSRAGFEANIALFFVVLGVWLVLSARSHPRRWIIAWLPFVAGVYTFNSTRYFSVFIGAALFVFTYRYIRKNKKQFIIGIIVACIAVLPIVPHMLSREARLRFVEVNIFTDASVVMTANERIARLPDNIINTIVNNRRVGYLRSYLIHFFDNLEPNFLFIKGDGNPKFSTQDVGQLYLIEAPFLAIGICAMLLSYPSIAALLLIWLVSAIVPAATARETPHALRILNSLPTWQIFIAFGIIYVYKKIAESKKQIAKYAFCCLLFVIYVFSIAYYLHNYYRHYPTEYSGEWQYGYREAIGIASKIEQKYDNVVVSDSIGRPYMYTLFYTKTDPDELFSTKDALFDAAGFYHVYGFGKYRFGGVLPPTLEPETLYIWDAGTVPEGARIIDTVRLLNGNPVLVVFDRGDVR